MTQDFQDRFAPPWRTPYYVAIFTAQSRQSADEVENMAAQIFHLAACHADFIGAELARESAGFGIVTIYWSDATSLRDWIARGKILLDLGASDGTPLLDGYIVRIARVEEEIIAPRP